MPLKFSERLRADLLLFLVAVIWGGAFVPLRLAGLAGSVLVFNGLRFLLAVLVLLPFAWRKIRLTRSFLAWTLAAGAVLFIGSALQQQGLRYTTAGNAGFMTSLYVVLVPFLLWAGWRERPSWLALAAVALAVGGAFLLSTGGESFRLQLGDAYELAGTLFWALHVVLLGKFAARFDALAFAVGQFAVCGLLNLAFGLPFEGFSLPLALQVSGAIVFTAIFSIAFGYTGQVWAQRHTPPTDAALLMSLEAVFAVLFGWLLLAEQLSILQGLGCALIFSAVLLAQLRTGFS